jgi:hypothetical protein
LLLALVHVGDLVFRFIGKRTGQYGQSSVMRSVSVWTYKDV